MIPSFKVDHTKLEPGLYVSRVDKWGMETATTFDIRVCKPNKDMMSPAVAHTIEHLMADYLRMIVLLAIPFCILDRWVVLQVSILSLKVRGLQSS